MSARPGAPVAARTRLLLTGPVLGTLLRLAAPNLGEAAARVAFISFDALFVSWLGADALAGVAIVFPIFLLMQMMSASGLGAGVSASIARAMGAGEHEDARELAWHALLLALAAGAGFSAIMLASGPALYRWMGLSGSALESALVYSNLAFGGIVLVWLMNTLANIARGTGNMVVPAAAIVAGESVHLLLSPALILGWGPFERIGVSGAALGVLASYLVGTAMLLAHFVSGHGDVSLARKSLVLRARHFASILGVGVFAALNVAQTQLTTILVSSFVATFGTAALAGYGAASRLELLLIPLSFALGSAILTMIATNAGAGDWQRVRKIARAGAAVATLIGAIIGAVAFLIPEAWMRFFASDPAILEPGVFYLRWLSATYPLFGFGLGIYFSLLGLGRPVWPFLLGTARLVVVAGSGWLLVAPPDGTLLQLCFVVTAGTATLAAGMLLAGRKLLFSNGNL